MTTVKDIFSDVTVVLRRAVWEGLPARLRTFLAVDATLLRKTPEALCFFFRSYRWYEEEHEDIKLFMEYLNCANQDDYSIREAVILRQRPYGSECNKGHYFGPFEVYYVPRLVVEVSGVDVST